MNREIEIVIDMAYQDEINAKKGKKRIHPSREEYGKTFMRMFPWAAAILKISEAQEKPQEPAPYKLEPATHAYNPFNGKFEVISYSGELSGTGESIATSGGADGSQNQPAL